MGRGGPANCRNVVKRARPRGARVSITRPFNRATIINKNSLRRRRRVPCMCVCVCVYKREMPIECYVIGAGSLDTRVTARDWNHDRRCQVLPGSSGPSPATILQSPGIFTIVENSARVATPDESRQAKKKPSQHSHRARCEHRRRTPE